MSYLIFFNVMAYVYYVHKPTVYSKLIVLAEIPFLKNVSSYRKTLRKYGMTFNKQNLLKVVVSL